VAVALGELVTPIDDRAIEHGAVPFGDLVEALEQVGELLGVPDVDFGELFDAVSGGVAIVR
jgi:hypothetical protein